MGLITVDTIATEKFTAPFFERFHMACAAPQALLLDDPLRAPNEEGGDGIHVDLQDSPHWEALLLGSLYIDLDGRLAMQPGPLVSALQEGAGPVTVQSANPGARTWLRSALVAGAFNFNGRTHQLPSPASEFLRVISRRLPDPAQPGAPSPSARLRVVNHTNFHTLTSQLRVEGSVLAACPSPLEGMCAPGSRSGPAECLIVTTDLDEWQWRLLTQVPLPIISCGCINNPWQAPELQVSLCSP